MRDLRSISKVASPLVRTFVIIVVVVMVVYPLLMVGIGQILFPSQANGSPMKWNETQVGSSLIAQNVSSPKLFHPLNATDSASGIDPDITPADAYAQVTRVSNATGIPASSLDYLIEKNIEGNRAMNLGLLAPDYVNVNELNLDLIQLYPSVYAEFYT